MRLGPLCLSFLVACTTDSGEPASNPDAASQGEEESRDETPREGESSSVEPSTLPADAQPPPPEPTEPTPAPQMEIAFVGDVIFGRYRPSGFDAIVEGDDMNSRPGPHHPWTANGYP